MPRMTSLSALPVMVMAAALFALPSALARPADIEGWRQARWGDDRQALDELFAEHLILLPQPWLYFDAYADRVMDVPFAGVEFLAIFQMSNDSDRLQQVTLEARGPQASPQAHSRVAAALADAYGPADRTCWEPKPEGEPMIVERVWRFPTTTVHATFLDFRTTGVFSEAPDVERDVLERFHERRRNHWRTLPRRIVLRYHPTERTDLLGECRPAQQSP